MDAILDEITNIVLSVGFSAIVLLLIAVFLYKRYFKKCNPHEKGIYTYGYSDYDGPHTWKQQFDINGQSQSPINILTVCGRSVPSEKYPCLTFSKDYHMTPSKIKIVNDGNNVVLYAAWVHGKRPIVCGGPLCEEYKFFNMRLRWGSNDEEGSEHMIDMRRYAMELQVAFNKCSCKCLDLSKSSRTCAVLIISYLFTLTATENPYFEPIMHGLQFIKKPCTGTVMRPFPISLLAPAFSTRYFSYIGSLTYPPGTESVRWIIQPEPLSISPEQLAKFRELQGINGLIFSNVRPVQSLNAREVLYYE